MGDGAAPGAVSSTAHLEPPTSPDASTSDRRTGRLVWNRLRYVKNPNIGKRVSRLTQEAEWMRKEVPELRIVPDDLWTHDKLLRQDLFEEFCDEFTRETNRLRMEHRASLSSAEREIERIETRRKKLRRFVASSTPSS